MQINMALQNATHKPKCTQCGHIYFDYSMTRNDGYTFKRQGSPALHEFPLLHLTCQNCNAVITYDAAKIGLI